MARNRSRGEIVRLAAHSNGVGRSERPGRRWCEREHLNVDSLLVHGGDTRVPDVFEALEVIAHLVEGEAVIAASLRQRFQGRSEFGRGPVFFDSDDRHDCAPVLFATLGR
jgi:hypothetical protein